MPVFVKTVVIAFIVSIMLMLSGTITAALGSAAIGVAISAIGYVLFIAGVFIGAVGLIYVVATD